MKTTHIRFLSSIFAVALSTIAINSAQAAAALDNATLTKASNLLVAKAKTRKVKNRLKSKITKKYAYKRHIKTCDTYSHKILRKKAVKYQADINQLAKQHKVSPHLIMAVITVESCFRESVRSPQGAAGLMQLIPATASRFGTEDRYNPRDNIKAGTLYLKFLLKRFKGDLRLVAAAYNAGEGAVDRYNGIPPYKETKAYVAKVLNAYNKLSKAASQKRNYVTKNTRKTKMAWHLRLAQNKQLTQLIDARSLAFTTPEWKQMAKILMSEQGKIETPLKQLL
jgi:soluble lytic murein transglycosylase-like protein